jgi:leucyl/phenylalanyl-tRNA--protein transferase
VPVEPAPNRWQLPEPGDAGPGDLAGVGADLEPGTLLAAYRSGLFPMRVGRRGTLGWFSPDPRGILPLDGMRVSRSLRASLHRFDLRVDTAFEAVVRGCADPRRPHGWIDESFVAAYTRLFDLGWAHSVEAWSPTGGGGGGELPGGELLGGVYGVAIGGFFAGESMFHRARDASKVALAALVTLLRDNGGRLFDVQWTTPHLVSLGAVDVSRRAYLGLLRDALREPLPGVFDRQGFDRQGFDRQGLDEPGASPPRR